MSVTVSSIHSPDTVPPARAARRTARGASLPSAVQHSTSSDHQEYPFILLWNKQASSHLLWPLCKLDCAGRHEDTDVEKKVMLTPRCRVLVRGHAGAAPLVHVHARAIVLPARHGCRSGSAGVSNRCHAQVRGVDVAEGVQSP